MRAVSTAVQPRFEQFHVSVLQKAGIASSFSTKETVARLFALAGISIDGPNPWDIRVGPDYDLTLMAWNSNFQSRRADLAMKHGERFCRMWEYYLLQNAAAFRCRHINIGQFVLTPDGLRSGYRSVL